MARTINEIHDQIITEKQSMNELNALQPEIDDAQTLLDDLKSSSLVAKWRLWVFLTAVAIWIHEKLWDVFKSEVDAIVAAAIPGTARWYRAMCLIYQHGDDLTYTEFKFQYDPIDPTKNIIARASATEQGGNVLLKVAKIENSLPVKLTTAELEAFTEYIDKIKFAGTFCPVISADPDLVNINLDVHYDPSLINANGELLSDTSIKPVEDAIINYLTTLPWNGTLRNSAVVDAAQASTGVNDIVLNLIEAKSNLAANYEEVERIYLSVAGYITLNDLNITYISV